jgi:hypothetical protein
MKDAPHSSSRRAVLKLLATGGALAGASAAAAHLLRAEPALASAMPAERTPWLVIRDAPAERPSLGTALFLALGCISREQQLTLLAALEFLFTALEAKHNPLLEDFMGEAADVEFEPLRRWFVPVLNAATALSRETWTLPGAPGSGSVQLCSAEQAQHQRRKLKAWGNSGLQLGTVERQALFAAWSISASTLIDLGSARALEAAQAALRGHVTQPDAHWALFLDARRQQAARKPVCSPLFDSIAERAARLLRRAPKLDNPILRALADARGNESLAPRIAPLSLAPTELLVVPRLSTAWRGDRGAAELGALLRRAGIAHYRRVNGAAT